MNRKISLVAFLGICIAACVWLLLVAGLVYGIVYWYFRPQFVVTSAVNFNEFLTTGPIGFPSLPLKDQTYAVSLELELPRSTVNQALGNFACFMTLNGHGQAQAKHTAMALLPFKSPLIDLLDQIVFAPLYILGLKSQLELVRLEMFDFIETPFDELRLKLSKPVELASATLIWSTKLHGFRKLMYHHALTTCFVCVGALWFVGLVVTITIGLLVHLKLDQGAGKSVGPTDRPTGRPSDKTWALEYLDSPLATHKVLGTPPETPASPKSPKSLPKKGHASRSPRARLRSRVRTPLRSSQPVSPQYTIDSDYQDTLPTMHDDFSLKK